MTRGWITRASICALCVVAASFAVKPNAHAQEAPLLDSPPKADDSSDVTEEGVPEEAVAAEQGVAEVEEAMQQVEEEIEQGLPEEFTIEFGDVYDWMRLTSGEWLKGRLKRMREDRIEFDSDKLDVVEFDWDKVDQLHCPQINTYVFEDKLDVVGRAVITKDTVLVETADGVVSYPRVELLSIVDGEPRVLLPRQAD